MARVPKHRRVRVQRGSPEEAALIARLTDEGCDACGRISGAPLIRHEPKRGWSVWCGWCVRGASDPVGEFTAREQAFAEYVRSWTHDSCVAQGVEFTVRDRGILAFVAAALIAPTSG